MTLRKAFEADQIRRGTLHVMLERDPFDEYELWTVQSEWVAFQAGAAHAARECADICNQNASIEGRAQVCEKAIRAAFPEAFR